MLCNQPLADHDIAGLWVLCAPHLVPSSGIYETAHPLLTGTSVMLSNEGQHSAGGGSGITTRACARAVLLSSASSSSGHMHRGSRHVGGG